MSVKSTVTSIVGRIVRKRKNTTFEELVGGKGDTDLVIANLESENSQLRRENEKLKSKCTSLRKSIMERSAGGGVKLPVAGWKEETEV